MRGKKIEEQVRFLENFVIECQSSNKICYYLKRKEKYSTLSYCNELYTKNSIHIFIQRRL